MKRRLGWQRLALPLVLAIWLPILAACGSPSNAAGPATYPSPTAASANAQVDTATSAAPAPQVAMAPSTVPLPVAADTVQPMATAQAAATPMSSATSGLQKLNHVIIIYQENWSFDSLYPNFPGANGIANAGAALKQVDKTGQPLAALPQPKDTNKKPAAPDARFPANLPVQPYDLTKYVSSADKIGDLLQAFYQEQQQIDGGKMDKFVSVSSNGGLTMGYFDAATLPQGALARQYTLADNYFHAAFGGSMLNHFWLISAATPMWPNAPANLKAQVDAAGSLVKDGAVTPDGYVVNTVYPAQGPHPKTITDTTQLVPAFTNPTIGDRLSAQGISWAWYSGGWSDALAGHADPLFQFNHQPFAYFANYANGTPGNAAHLKDETDFMKDLQSGSLPAVSFVKMIGADNEHPGYANLFQGQKSAADLVQAIHDSAFWKDTAIILTYDENGGFWDHVAPPAGDRWGPGTRVLAVIISPFAKKGFVDHTQYDTTSVLKLIENRWGLAPLGTRDAAAVGFDNAFDFSGTGN